MSSRNIYLKIEPSFDYSPVPWRRDCMREPGHEDGTIPLSEVMARQLTALVYREYLDSAYSIPKPDKLVIPDINEPPYHRRVPGSVIYAHPDDRLYIHVLNGDSMPHSFHVHGLVYGIASDGAWPFGTTSGDGRRSDEICPGQTWTYIYDVTDETVGAWPFHDHAHHIAESVNRGLFGAIIVLPRAHKRLEPVPMLLPDVVKTMLHRPPVPTLGPGIEHREGGTGHVEAETAMHGMGGGGDHPLNVMPKLSLDPAVELAQMFLMEWASLSYAHPRPKHDEALHVPLFIHTLVPRSRHPAFDRPLNMTAGPLEIVFGAEGEFPYHCEIHPAMHGKVRVVAGGAPDANVQIVTRPDGSPAFFPDDVSVRPGGRVRWQPVTTDHTITDDGAGLPSYCVNGRSFVGNTPTIVAHAGQKIRWYVFNLDLGMTWHNFHPHGQRWKFADQMIDNRSIGPAESFFVETTAPPVVLLPPDLEEAQDPAKRPKGAKEYCVRGDFLVHCHVEMHMMEGLAGLVRSEQRLWLTPAQAAGLAALTGLPLDPGTNNCPDVDPMRCEKHGCGEWREVPGAPGVTLMHATLLPKTNRVLFFGYGDARREVSRIWDYSMSAGAYSWPLNQPADVASTPGNLPLANIWSAAHTALDDDDGTLLVHGGFTPRESYLFNPTTLAWERTAPTVGDRFYATTITLADGKALTLFGNVNTIEVYDPGARTWSAPKNLPTTFNYRYYPWTYLLPGGDLFIAGHQGATRRFDWTVTPIVDKPVLTIAGDRSGGAERGTSLLLPLRPPGYAPRVLIAGGDSAAARQSAEMIDLSAATPAWKPLPALNVARPDPVNSVLLPDGRILVVGGVPDAGGPAEIFDPDNPDLGWIQCAAMTHPRGYHSAAILLADGSVLVGGDMPPCNLNRTGETTPNERYFPSYCAVPRPTLGTSPGSTTWGATFTVASPQATVIAEVVLIRPGFVTHGFNASQRFVECVVASRSTSSLDVRAPTDRTIGPPGWYLLFIVDGARIPSRGNWIRLT